MQAAALAPEKSPWPRLGIVNRRYLGGKGRLLPFITEVVRDRLGTPSSFADLMAGTGVVAHGFNAAGTRVLANDLLLSNHLAHQCFLGTRDEGPEAALGLVEELAALPADPGYFTACFGGLYFTQEAAGRIDAVRERIDRWSRSGAITPEQEAVLLTSLLYGADKIANTCGHYDSFRRVEIPDEPLTLRLPDYDPSLNDGNACLNEDANALAERIEAEVIYLDPPYNSRQYSDTYHLLENLARWEKPEVHGAARKMDRSALKSRYCGRDAAQALDELVQAAACKVLVLSYNNMGGRGVGRSQAAIADEDLLAILRRRGEVEILTRTFLPFSAGLADHREGHEERLFLCWTSGRPRRGARRRRP